MWSLLSKALIVLMIALFVPTGLVLASQDAVPGDRAYPVKRGLENVIVTLASLHPTTRAFFKTDMAGRRYKEAVALIRRGDQGSSQSLTELVAQTQAAATDISQISDPTAKQQLVDNLSKQIVQYKAGLSQLETTALPVAPEQPIVQAPVQPTQPPVQIAPPQPTTITSPAQQQALYQNGTGQAPSQAGTSAQPTAPVRQPPAAAIIAPKPSIAQQLAPSSPPSVPPPLPAQQSPVPPPSSIGSAISDLEAIEERLSNLSQKIEGDKSSKEVKRDKESEGLNNKDSGGAKKRSGKDK